MWEKDPHGGKPAESGRQGLKTQIHLQRHQSEVGFELGPQRWKAGKETLIQLLLILFLQELEVLQQNESDTAQDQIRDLEDQLSTTEQQLREVETDLRQKTEELRYAEDEGYKSKMSLQTRLQDREDDIQKLRNQVKNDWLASNSIQSWHSTQILTCLLDHGMGIEKGPIFGVLWSPSPDRMKFDAQGFSMVLIPNLVVAKL